MVDFVHVPQGFSRSRARFAGAVFFAASLATVSVLGGCAQEGAGDASEQPEAAVQPAPESAAEETVAQKAADQYRLALEDAQGYFDDIDASLIGSASYDYALVDMDGLEAPLLLVRASGPADVWNGIEFVKVLSYRADAEAPLVYEGSLEQGVAGVGGYRGSLAASASGDGLIATEVAAGMGNMSVDRVMPDEATGVLSRTVMHRGTVGENSACSTLASSEQREIAWVPIDEAAALDALADGSHESTADAAGTDWAAQAQQAGLTPLEGTLHVLNADGVAALQGEQNPNPGYGNDVIYVVLELDAPVTLSALSGDGSGMREGQAAMVSLIPSGGSSGMELPRWYRENWAALDGKKAIVAVSPDKMWWPSDTSVPLGEPRTSEFVVLAS
ncbi:MAG: hypothetical protein Q4B69_07520 [Slackia sp.]|nr:hypothetical protein [Slackia sp.]